MITMCMFSDCDGAGLVMMKVIVMVLVTMMVMIMMTEMLMIITIL